MWTKEKPLLRRILHSDYFCPYCETFLDMDEYYGYCGCGEKLYDYDGIGGFWNEDNEDEFDEDAMTV